MAPFTNVMSQAKPCLSSNISGHKELTSNHRPTVSQISSLKSSKLGNLAQTAQYTALIKPESSNWSQKSSHDNKSNLESPIFDLYQSESDLVIALSTLKFYFVVFNILNSKVKSLTKWKFRRTVNKNPNQFSSNFKDNQKVGTSTHISTLFSKPTEITIRTSKAKIGSRCKKLSECKGEFIESLWNRTNSNYSDMNQFELAIPEVEIIPRQLGNEKTSLWSEGFFTTTLSIDPNTFEEGVTLKHIPLEIKDFECTCEYDPSIDLKWWSRMKKWLELVFNDTENPNFSLKTWKEYNKLIEFFYNGKPIFE